MIIEEKRDPKGSWSGLTMSELNFEKLTGNIFIQRQNSVCEF